MTFNKKIFIKLTFEKYPEIAFTPKSMSFTTNIIYASTKRICQELKKDGLIELIAKGVYKWKVCVP